MRLKYLSLLFVPLFILTSCQPQNPNEENYRAAYIAINNLLDQGKIDELDNYIAADAVDHQLNPAITSKTGLDGIKEMFRYYHRIFPDMKTTVHSMAVSGDTLFGYVTSSGTTSEPFMGMPANTETSVNLVDIVVFKDGKMTEHWGFMDMTEAMQMMQSNMPMDEGMMDGGMQGEGMKDGGMKMDKSNKDDVAQ